MRSNARISAFLLGLILAQPLLAQTQPVKISGLVELSGTGATSGTNFDDGVKLAVKEINAAGGILGRKIDYTSERHPVAAADRQGARVRRPSTTAPTS